MRMREREKRIEMKKKKFPKCCYYCKHLYNISTQKYCINRFKDGFDPCEKFEFCATCKSV